MPGYGNITATGTGAGSATASSTSPPFTGAAGKVVSQGAMVVLGGVIAGLML